ncbi:Hypothetical protein CINCED_3A023765 [Cinara cedri]|uniref:Uncharacterized protein n=1 Tax=Cinara cedri TaxID=506608 RepID=A0A5E4NNB2_9HEMI|nr:Hypothetical protein CINCED_3A023765 [Cinara cedri]
MPAQTQLSTDCCPYVTTRRVTPDPLEQRCSTNGRVKIQLAFIGTTVRQDGNVHRSVVYAPPIRTAEFTNM